MQRGVPTLSVLLSLCLLPARAVGQCEDPEDQSTEDDRKEKILASLTALFVDPNEGPAVMGHADEQHEQRDEV